MERASVPPARTISAAPAQRTFIHASASILRRPSSHFVIGSWARTIRVVFANQTKPIQRSATPAWFFAYTGMSAITSYPAATKITFCTIRRTKAPSRATSR